MSLESKQLLRGAGTYAYARLLGKSAERTLLAVEILYCHRTIIKLSCSKNVEVKTINRFVMTDCTLTIKTFEVENR